MTEKSKSVLSYIFGWISGIIILFCAKNNQRNTKVHAAQSIVISVGYLLLRFVYRFIPLRIPFFNQFLWCLFIILIIFGILKAIKQENPELPVISDIAKAIFKEKIEE